MHRLYELKEILCEELESYGTKETIDVSSLNIIDTLAHSIKNIDKIIEAHEGRDGYSENDRRNSMMYPMEHRYYDGTSYARGKTGNVRRDSRGRYSADDHSKLEHEVDNIVMELHEMMKDLPQDKQKQVQRFINNIESM